VTFIGEWMRTGDKYVRDAEGWFTYAGRADDMLKVGGIYVAPGRGRGSACAATKAYWRQQWSARRCDGLIKPRRISS